MMRSSCAALVLLLAAGAAACAEEDEEWRPPPPPPAPAGAFEEAQAWAVAHAEPLATIEAGQGFADLAPLGERIGERRVVAFGEGMHDTREFLLLRNRLFEYLVETKGFTAYAAETGVTEATLANRYVAGEDVDPAAAATAVFSWATEGIAENLALLDWMRGHNARNPGQPLRFYGLDLTGGRSGEFTGSRAAVDAALGYLRKVDAGAAGKLEAVLSPLLGRFNTAGHAGLSGDERNRLSGALTDLVGLLERNHVAYVAASDEAGYFDAHRNAVVAQQLDMNFRWEGGQSQRDAAMARNLMAALQREGTRGKVMVFSYVGHVRRGAGDGDFQSLGQYASALLGDELYVIGSYFDVGEVGLRGEETWPIPPSPPGSLNAAWLAGAKRPMFMLDMRQLPADGPFARWLADGKPGRNHYWEGSPAGSFDTVIYLARISAATPLPPPP